MSFTIRSLLRTPGFTATVVLVLALGIGANSAIFSIVNAVLLRPLPFHDPDRLYRLNEIDPKRDPSGVSPADLTVFQQRVGGIEAGVVSHWQNVTLTGPEGAENLFGGKISAGGFSILGVQPARGRVFREDEFRAGATPVVLLSDRLWQRRFGRDPAVIGRSMGLNGTPHTIVGVMPADFFFDHRFELWTPWQFTADEASKREARAYTAVRLRPGARPQQVEADLLGVLRSIASEDVAKGWEVRLTALATEMTSRFRAALLVSLGAVGFVLLIACINVANLLLARASDRRQEMSIRMALGAGRGRVVRQFLMESLLLAGAGGAAGLLLGYWSAKALVATFPERIPLPRLEQTHLDLNVALFSLGITLLTGVLFGLLPGLQASSHDDVNQQLKEGGRASTGGSRGRGMRNLLVIMETALSLVLLAGAGLMLRSFDRLMRIDPGFIPERVLTLRVPLPAAITAKPQQAPYYARMLARIQAIPGINSAGVIAPLPLGDVDANGTFGIEGRPAPPGEQYLVRLHAVTPGYFRAMGLTLRRGRVFQEGDRAGAPEVALVSESLARKYFPDEDPIGRRVTMSSEGKGPFMQIVGVVKDVKYVHLSAPTEPELYRDSRQFFFAGFAMTLVLRTAADDPMRIAAAVQKEIRALNPDQPIGDVRPMEKVVADNVSQPRFYTMLLTAFAALALLLAATGLYGVLSFAVTRRTHEIGVRMALGAERPAIFRLVILEALQLVGAGVVLGIGGAVFLTRLIATQLYQTAPVDAATFAVVSAVMLAVGVAAACIPAWRAVGLDPVRALWGR